MRHAPDNLVKEEPSAGGVGEGVVVERAVEATSSIGNNLRLFLLVEIGRACAVAPTRRIAAAPHDRAPPRVTAVRNGPVAARNMLKTGWKRQTVR